MVCASRRNSEPWLEARRRAAERKELRREYELKVQSGEWPAHETKVPLFPYQREGMLHLAFTERALLADEMGLGKTIQAIAACALLPPAGPGPPRAGRHARLAQDEWEEQIQRFTDLPYQLGLWRRPDGPAPGRLTASGRRGAPVLHHRQLRADARRRAGRQRALRAGHRGAGRSAAHQELEHQDHPGHQAPAQPLRLHSHRHAH
jgi:hypothetical protein